MRLQREAIDALTPMSKVNTANLAQVYEGVTDQTLSGSDPVEVGLKPAGLSKLKEHYEALPYFTDDEVLKKIGLTDSGHAVYRNVDTGALIYHTISIRNDGVELGRWWGRHEPVPKTTEPHDGFGDSWILKPHRSQLPREV